jgi:hypothetical protein
VFLKQNTRQAADVDEIGPSTFMKIYIVLLAAVLLITAAPAPAQTGKPSRKPLDRCAWEKLSDTALGLEAWVQRCDFGDRKIDFLVVGNSLAQRYSDGGDPDRLVDVIDLNPGETPQSGIKRFFEEHTDKTLASRCVLAPLPKDYALKPRAGVKRYTFVPNRAFAKELKTHADPNDVPEPPCGAWGIAPDGLDYFEAQPASGARKVLFVNYGQEEPLFDEATLRLMPPR